MSDRTPAFDGLPSGLDIAHWFVDEKRHEENVGGDAWWLCREPHGSARMLSFVDYDTQEFWLLDITTGSVSDLLYVTNGLDGLSCEWWQHPTSLPSLRGWYTNGVRWLADQVEAHLESRNPTKDRRPHSRACGVNHHPHGHLCHRNCPTCHGRNET